MPTATLTPRPTPAPTTQPSINLAPINDGQWHTDNTWSIAPANNVYIETNQANQHNGAATFRIEGTNVVEWAVDHNVLIHSGDHVVISGWIKTSGTYAGAQHGAYIGLDYYGTYNGAWARIGGMNCESEAAAGMGYPNWNGNPGDVDNNFVNWGSGWSFREWDFIVPAQAMGDGLMSSHQVPQGVMATVGSSNVPSVVWFMIWGGDGFNGLYTSWLSDFQVYVNP